jgi:catechol 2,3-dioxygenase-like lactoylglutathione lyase family enzyme
MTVMRVERVVYGVSDLEECTRFFADFGLEPVDGGGNGNETQVARFVTPAGQVVELRAADDPGLPPAVEDGSTLREVVWGVDTAEALDALAATLAADRETRLANGEVHTVDETGFGVGLAVSTPAATRTEYPGSNRTGSVTRWNRPLQPPGRVRPLRLCHVAVNIEKAGRERAAAFYTDLLGFVPTDRVRDMGVFMRCPGDTDQHTLLLCHRPDRAGVNHTAYEVANVDEVIVGANDMIDRGWHEARRLGRHTVGSNIFRFIHAPCGGRVEFAADMDRVDDSYGPNDYAETPPHHIWTLKSSRDTQETSPPEASDVFPGAPPARRTAREA